MSWWEVLLNLVGLDKMTNRHGEPTYPCICAHPADEHDSLGGCFRDGCDCPHGIPLIGTPKTETE